MNNPGRQKIQQLLEAIGSRQMEPGTKIEAVEYDWRQPHYFSSRQIEKLEGFAEKVTLACGEKFSRFYHSDFTAKVVSITQHYSGDFTAGESSKSDYYVTLYNNQKRVYGVVGIPAGTAAVWTKQLLGDSKTAESADNGLSQLEQSLLTDIASGVAVAFSSSYDHSEQQSGGEPTSGVLPLKVKGDEELCKITFSVAKAGSENPAEAYFLIFCEALKKIVEENTQGREEISAKDASKLMLGYVHKVPVTLTARLGSVEVTFEEITNMDTGDILLLDKKVTMPVELILEGKTLFRGRLAKSEGRQAVVITEAVTQNKS